jgi:hypothetical protein
MVRFIRGYVERQSGAARGRVSDEVQLALGAVRPVRVHLLETFPSGGWKYHLNLLARRTLR